MFKLPDLPYAYDALQPAMSAETLRLHHDKHHAAYVKTTNELLEQEGAPAPAQTLEEVVLKARRDGASKLFNNAAQAWNHAFFWNCMTPGGSQPQGDLGAAIDSAFGGLDQLKQKFVTEGVDHFGSGWAWLIADAKGLRVISTHDAGDRWAVAERYLVDRVQKQPLTTTFAALGVGVLVGLILAGGRSR